MSSHVFLSYASTDEPVAEEIYEALEAQELRCWFAPRSIQVGDNWEEAILTAIQTSQLVILIFSSHTNLSRDVAREIHHAVRNNKVVIPIRIEQTSPLGTLAYLLSNVQWFDAVLPPLSAHLDKVFKRVRELAGRNVDIQRIRRPPQEVFPYLLDRSEQEESLVQALEKHRDEKSSRPFVCVLHGDELECHTLYLKRLKIRSLPEILSASCPVESKNTPIEQFDIQLPLNKTTKSEYERSIWLSLRAATHGSKPVSEEEIIKFVASHKLSVIIKCSILTEDLKRDYLKSIDWFFKFWERWPEISNLLVFVAISFKYQRTSTWKRHPIKRWSMRRLNQHIRHYLSQLDLSKYKGIYGTVLPELVAIPRRDAEALIRHEHVSPYSDLDDRDIRTLYGNLTLCTPDGSIPMETLLDQLIHISNQKREQRLRRL